MAIAEYEIVAVRQGPLDLKYRGKARIFKDPILGWILVTIDGALGCPSWAWAIEQLRHILNRDRLQRIPPAWNYFDN